MKAGLRIVIVGTVDTKAEELLFMKRCIEAEGGAVTIMDVGVLGKPAFDPPQLVRRSRQSPKWATKTRR